jgi:hypothetical protein
LGFQVTLPVTLPLISFLTVHIENTSKSSKCRTSLENPPYFFFKVSASVSYRISAIDGHNEMLASSRPEAQLIGVEPPFSFCAETRGDGV